LCVAPLRHPPSCQYPSRLALHAISMAQMPMASLFAEQRHQGTAKSGVNRTRRQWRARQSRLRAYGSRSSWAAAAKACCQRHQAAHKTTLRHPAGCIRRWAAAEGMHPSQRPRACYRDACATTARSQPRPPLDGGRQALPRKCPNLVWAVLLAVLRPKEIARRLTKASSWLNNHHLPFPDCA